MDDDRIVMALVIIFPVIAGMLIAMIMWASGTASRAIRDARNRRRKRRGRLPVGHRIEPGA